MTLILDGRTDATDRSDEKIKDRQDVEACLDFASIYQPLIFNICRSKGMQHADATDVTQEV